MKVIAIKQGFYGKLHTPGDEFEVPDGTKGSWFHPVAVEQKPASKSKKAETLPAEPPAADTPAEDLV